MSDMPNPRHEDWREALAFERKLNPKGYAGADELHPPVIRERSGISAENKKALEAEAWYQDWKRLREATKP